MTKTWKDSSGNLYDITDVIKKISHNSGNRVYIGSDSHRSRKGAQVMVATAICVWDGDARNGGWYCFNRKSVPKKTFKSLFERLYHEVECSIETACMLRDNMQIDVEEIHVNVNPLESEASGKYANQLSGVVEGYGFRCVLKPGDWAAGGVADKHAR